MEGERSEGHGDGERGGGEQNKPPEKEDALLKVKFRCKVETHVPINTVTGVGQFEEKIADYVMITMGGRMKQFEKEIGNDGIIDIDWEISPIKKGASYYNQMDWDVDEPVSNEMRRHGLNYDSTDDLKVKSHAIMWIYKKHKYDPAARFNQDEGENESDKSSGSIVHRCYLIGSCAIDLLALMDASIKVKESDEKISFKCRHNFCKTYAECTLLPWNEVVDSEVQAERNKLKEGLDEYDKEEKLAVKDDRQPDHSKHDYMYSPLRNMKDVNNIVRLQQDLMQTYCIMEVQKGSMRLCDQMSAAFLSGSTFCQLYGASVCFTDMTHIVRNRVVEFPFHLIFRYVFLAMGVNGFNEMRHYERVAKMETQDHVTELVRLYKCILTAEIMDSKQSEYYSDYCIHGVQGCTELDYKINRQPMPLFDDKEELGEMWFYEKHEEHLTGDAPKYVRYRMKLTEDQKQVCTGEGLWNRIIADDCETSASAIKGVHKTLMVIKAFLQKRDFLKVGYLDWGMDPSSESFNQNWKDLAKELMVVSEGSKPIFHSDFGEDKKVWFLAALANILRQFDFTLDLCIGTANAAGVGQKKNVCGHCYLILTSVHHKHPTPIRCIIEVPSSALLGGVQNFRYSVVKNLHSFDRNIQTVWQGTNWVLQKKDLEDPLNLSQNDYQMINEASAGLMEITKLAKIDPRLDIGKGLTKMCEGGGNASQFYMNAYVCGEEIQLGVPQFQTAAGPNETTAAGEDIASTLVYGVPVSHIVDNSRLIKRIPVAYALAAKHLRQSGHSIDATTICDAIRAIGNEETVPAWTKENWDKVTGTYRECKILEVTDEKFDETKHIRFVFVHQYYEGMDDSTVYELQENIKNVLASGAEPVVTQKHRDMLKGQIPGMDPEHNMPDFDVHSTNQKLAGIQNLIKIESMMVVMDSFVTVCLVEARNLESLHSMLMDWTKNIVSAKNEKQRMVHDMLIKQVRENIKDHARTEAVFDVSGPSE